MPRFRSEAKKLSCWRTRIEGLSQSFKMRQWADGSVFSDSCSWGYLLEKAERKMPAEHATEFASACTHSHHVAMPCNAKQAGCWWEVFSAHYVVFPLGIPPPLAEAIGGKMDFKLKWGHSGPKLSKLEAAGTTRFRSKLMQDQMKWWWNQPDSQAWFQFLALHNHPNTVYCRICAESPCMCLTWTGSKQNK